MTSDYEIILEDPDVAVIEVGIQGPPGPTGSAGGGYPKQLGYLGF